MATESEKPTLVFEFENEEAKGEFEAWFSNSGEQDLYESLQHGPIVPLVATVEWDRESKRYRVKMEEDERFK